MRILMMTNTYLPHVGGVAHSVASTARALRMRGQEVLVVAPTFEGMSEDRAGVVRVPAVQNFNGSDFSVRLPIPGFLSSEIDEFEPHLVHSHHPFLMGDTALRVATTRDLAVVFTHHTMYERYTHYVPGDSEPMRRFAVEMATEYANLCDRVVAPSESIAGILRDRGVETPIRAIPTGIDPDRFADGDGRAARRRHGIPEDAFVVGHVGRLAPEKNLAFLARAVAGFLQEFPSARFLLVGSGPSEEEVDGIFHERGIGERLHATGTLEGEELTDAYHAMDLFAFASKTETQGMVLAEAMTAGVPVVALDAPGAREVVEDGANGRLLDDDDEERFAAALAEHLEAGQEERGRRVSAARETAADFTLSRSVERLVDVYREALEESPERRSMDDTPWTQALRLLATEWNLWKERADAAVRALGKAEGMHDPGLDEREGGSGDHQAGG